MNGDDRRCNLNQLLFADDITLVADSEDKVSAGGKAWTSV